MKLVIIYTIAALLIIAADAPGRHSVTQKFVRGLFWPITLFSWFEKQPIQLHRLLTIFWVCLTGGWFLSLLWDRL